MLQITAVDTDTGVGREVRRVSDVTKERSTRSPRAAESKETRRDSLSLLRRLTICLRRLTGHPAGKQHPTQPFISGRLEVRIRGNSSIPGRCKRSKIYAMYGNYEAENVGRIFSKT